MADKIKKILRTYVILSLFWIIGSILLCDGEVLSSFCLAKAFGGVQDDSQAYGSFSFSRQAQEAMKLYLENKTLPLLDSLDFFQENFEKSAPKPLKDRLNEGKKLENKGLVSVLDLMSLQMEHNNRMDTWAGKEKKRRNYFAGFRLGKRLIERLRWQNFPRDWPYVACHWHPFAVWSGLKDREIPNLIGLNMNNLEFDDPLFHHYTFFGFLRKMTARQEYIQTAYLPLAERYQALGMNPSQEKFDAFLNVQTGFATNPPLWNSNEKEARLSRWKYEDYYVYRYINHCKLPAENPPLIEAILNQCIFSRVKEQKKDFRRFYDEKRELFSDLVDEMLFASDRSNEIPQYWSLYSFIARTFPYMSSFKLTQTDSGEWCFIDGYEGDRPAQKKFGEDGEDSVMSLCKTILDKLNDTNPDEDLIDKIFGPIFLLQQRVLDPNAVKFEDQFIDIKVGFKGFLDYYKSLN